MPTPRTFPFTSNLPLNKCNLWWAGEEGHPGWPGERGHFAYSPERMIRVDGIVTERGLSDLPGKGRWGSYRSPELSFYFPVYVVTHKDNLTQEIENNKLLEIRYSFTKVLSWDLNSRLALEEQGNFQSVKTYIEYANVLFSSWGGLHDKLLARVESFVFEGFPDTDLVSAHANERYREWIGGKT